MIDFKNPIILVEKTAEDARLSKRAVSIDYGLDVCVKNVVKVYDNMN